MSENLKFLRRGVNIQEIEDIVEYQTEIQHPCDFDDSEDYALFCINEGIRFYYCDEGYCDEEDENYKEPSDEMYEIRDEVGSYLDKKYYDSLVELYNELVENCE